LISNAIKFTPIGGEVNVVVESNEMKVKVKVIDNGPGISNNEQKKLFKKFSRLSTIPTAGENSTGLGLSIVKKLANLINCDVYYDSNTKTGATFVLELPVSK
jgi:signal transduction histidine kinase